MEKTIFIISLILLIVACSEENNNVKYFSLNTNSVVKIKNVNDSVSINVFGTFKTIFPYEYKNTDTISIAQGNTSRLNFAIQKPELVRITLNDLTEGFIFILPNDSTSVNIDLLNHEKPIKIISSKNYLNTITEYYYQKDLLFGNSLFERRMAVQNPSYSLEQYNDSIKEFINIELSFFNKFKDSNHLPLWFQDYEKSEITYQIGSLLDIVSYRKQIYNINESIPNDYYNFITDDMVNNPKAIYSSNYLYFLSTLFYHKFTPKEYLSLTVKDRLLKMLPKEIKLADSLLSSYNSKIFKLYLATNLALKLNNITLTNLVIDELTLSNYDKEYLSFLVSESNKIFVLNKNTIAPGFYLENEEGKFLQLNDLEGETLLLNFWFPGCKPCIKEIVYEKEICNAFKNDKFQIVNICFFTTRENWLKALEEYEMVGINLLANERWQKNLINSYIISGYPHYALISENGKIIENDCIKPSEGLKKVISKLLN